MSRIIDLTMKIHEGMAYNRSHGKYPIFESGSQTHENWKRRQIENVYQAGDLVSFQNESITISGHTGTHMDACFHADPESSDTIDKMPIERGVGDAICLDVSHLFRPKGVITAKDLKEAEEKSGSRIQTNDIVVIRTDWDTMLHDPETWYASYIGLNKEAGEWLREKKVKTVALDSCNIDSVNAKDLPVHMNFLRPRSIGLGLDDYIAIIENLQGIQHIPKSRFKFFGTPLPLQGATASPIRAFALVE